MDLQTYTATLRAPRDTVFNFLANIENLPRWAASFCEQIYIEGGRWKGLTVQGESCFELDACGAKGVVILRAGTSHDRLAPLPMLVLAIGEERTLVVVTFAPAAGVPTGILRRDAEGIAEDLRRLAKRFGGHVHLPAREPEPIESAEEEEEVCGSTQFFI
jgi:hypothetical protein